MTTNPPPHPSGYQPAPGEGLTSIEVEVLPSWDFQKVAVRGAYTFPEPRALPEAQAVIEDIYSHLEAEARAKLDRLIDIRNEYEGAEKAAKKAKVDAVIQPDSQPSTQPAATEPPKAPHPAAGVDADHPAGKPEPGPVDDGPQDTGGWRIGRRPKNKGTFKYRGTDVVDGSTFIDAAKQLIAQEGINPDEVVVFDDRTGKYGLESGNESYSAGKIKAREDTDLRKATGDRDIVAYVDFDEDDGSLQVHLSKNGKEALQALTLAKELGATEVSS